MTLPRWPRCYLRLPAYVPELPENARKFAQDMPTVILLARWLHLHNVEQKHWFLVQGPRPKVSALKRPGTELLHVSMRHWWSLGGRARRELLEDIIGIRTQSLARFLRRIWPFSRWSLIERLTEIDTNQDWSQWHKYEQPRVVRE